MLTDFLLERRIIIAKYHYIPPYPILCISNIIIFLSGQYCVSLDFRPSGVCGHTGLYLYWALTCLGYARPYSGGSTYGPSLAGIYPAQASVVQGVTGSLLGLVWPTYTRPFLGSSWPGCSQPGRDVHGPLLGACHRVRGVEVPRGMSCCLDSRGRQPTCTPAPRGSL